MPNLEEFGLHVGPFLFIGYKHSFPTPIQDGGLQGKKKAPILMELKTNNFNPPKKEGPTLN